MKYRQWKKNYKKKHGVNPPLELDKRKQRRLARKMARQINKTLPTAAETLTAAINRWAQSIKPGVEMPPEAESWVQLHESELTELMQKQAKAAITELKRQEKQERKKEKYHNTFTLMKCYRDAVFHIENAISDGQQLELKGMTDEQQRTYLESIRRTRFKTLIMTAHIDKAVEEIERRREAAGRGVEYKAFEMYFMQGMDYAEIAEELDTGKNTPRRWVTGIINELSVLLWGIDEERVK